MRIQYNVNSNGVYFCTRKSITDNVIYPKYIDNIIVIEE